MDRCLNCNHTIRLINYALGPEWMHIDPSASFPNPRTGTAWKHCRVAVAEPAPEERAEPEEGAK